MLSSLSSSFFELLALPSPLLCQHISSRPVNTNTDSYPVSHRNRSMHSLNKARPFILYSLLLLFVDLELGFQFPSLILLEMSNIWSPPKQRGKNWMKAMMRSFGGSIHGAPSFTSYNTYLSRHKQKLSGDLMKYFLEGSAPLRLWMFNSEKKICIICYYSHFG